MVQRDRSENLDQAVENVENTYQEYIKAISAAVTLAGLPSGSLNRLTNDIVECHSMIVTACKDAKRKVRYPALSDITK